MFTKKKTTKKKVVVPTVETRTVTVPVPTAQGLKDLIVPAVTAAAAIAKDYSSDAKNNAGDYLELGKNIAEKQAHNAKEFVGDNAKLSALVASGAAARGEAARRSHDAALVLKGDAVIKRKKKGHPVIKLISKLGLLSALGGAAAYAYTKFQGPKDDPWARPLTDPYVAPAEGRDATVAAGEGVQVAEVGEKSTETEIIVPQGQVRTEGDNRN